MTKTKRTPKTKTPKGPALADATAAGGRASFGFTPGVVALETPPPNGRPAPVLGGLQELFLDQVHAWPGNRDLGDLAELIESVRAQGILQPVLVRPHPEDDSAFQVVAGHRRVEAARLAGLHSIPGLVRNLDDRSALEVQLVENLQRKDLDPLEEAAAYRLLIDRHGHTAETLAARVGRSRGYVYGRLRLIELALPVGSALRAGKLELSTALLLARIPDKRLQVEALDELLERPLNHADAAALIQARFMLELGAAPFDVRDAELVPAAGSCGSCSKRTGNQPELFGDVRSKDLCTDPACFEGKVEAAWKRSRDLARADGLKVLEGKAAAKALAHGSAWVDVDSPLEALGGKTPRKVLKADLPRPTMARTDERGRPTPSRELVKAEDLRAALKKAGVPAKGLGKRAAQEPGRRDELERSRLKRAQGLAMVAACLEAVDGREPGLAVVDVAQVLAAFVLEHVSPDVARLVARRRGLGTPDKFAPEAREKGLAFSLTLALELALQAGVPSSFDARLAREPLETAGHVLGVDLKAVAKAARKGPFVRAAGAELEAAK